MGRVGLGVGARFEGFVSFAGSLLCCVFREELTTLRKPNQPSRDQQGMDLSACTATWDANGVSSVLAQPSSLPEGCSR
jgi:hypothetical protein